MLESNPPPGDVKLWMPGTYLWLADHIELTLPRRFTHWKLVGVALLQVLLTYRL